MRFPLGKTPARTDAVKLKLAKYINLAALPKPPSSFGHTNLLRGSQGMLGNDEYGCCVWSGGAHETMLWNAEAGVPVKFTANGVLSDYSADTGFKKGDPSTDRGTDMQQAASYRQKIGIVDAAGKRHKIGAYLALETGNLNEMLVASWLFGSTGVGLSLQEAQQEQFQNGHVWDVVPGSPDDGGHYVPIMAVHDSLLVFSTWATFQLATDRLYEQRSDEALVYLSDERLKGGESIDGFKRAALLDDLAQLGHPII